SRANTRTEGEACAALNACRSTGGGAAAAGAGLGGGASFGGGAGFSFAAAAPAFSLAGEGRGEDAACVSSVNISAPSLTLSPTLSLTSLTTPEDGDGTSIVALSDSSVISESSAFTASPGFTNTSITGTSLKSPMSGTLTSIVLIVDTG